MMTAFAGMSETVVKLVGLAVTMSGNRGRDRDGEVAVRGNSNLRLGTLAPFCTGACSASQPDYHAPNSRSSPSQARMRVAQCADRRRIGHRQGLGGELFGRRHGRRADAQ